MELFNCEIQDQETAAKEFIKKCMNIISDFLMTVIILNECEFYTIYFNAKKLFTGVPLYRSSIITTFQNNQFLLPHIIKFCLNLRSIQ